MLEKYKNTTSLVRGGIFALFAAVVLSGIIFAGAQFGNRPVITASAPDGTTKRVIVEFKDVVAATDRSNVKVRQNAISSADAKVEGETQFTEGYKNKIKSYDNLPFAVYEVDEKGEASLRNDPKVSAVRDDKAYSPQMNTVLSTLGGSTSGFVDPTDGTFTGAGTAVAILDTGTYTAHPMFNGKIAAEACFSENGVYTNATVASLCPGAVNMSTAAGSSSSRCSETDVCDHGTHVASLAAGSVASLNTGTGNASMSGVAKDAKIISIQVFSKVTSASLCPSGGNPCVMTLDSSIAEATDYLVNLSRANTLGVPIVAANMSLGGGAYDTVAACDAANAVYKQSVALLRGANIAPVISNGNDGSVPANAGKLGAPGCVTGSIAVGATNKAGTSVASYSQNGPRTTILAPGGDYDGTNANTVIFGAAKDSNTNVEAKQGTSMAAPVVTGSIAVLREKHPKASIDQIVSLLQNSGANVVDNRAGYNSVAKKRVNLQAALVQSPYAKINSFTGPSGTVNEGATITLNASVANATTCSLNNGIGQVAISSGTITKQVPGAASYTLTCNNSYGDTTTRAANFTVNPAPTRPTDNGSAYSAEAKSYEIKWNPSTDANGVLEYRVFKNGQLVATLDSTASSYTFTGLEPDVRYNFEVRAVDTLGAISTAFAVSHQLTTPGAGGTEGVPNTGVKSLVTNSALQSVVVLGLGIAIVAGIAVTVRRNVTK